MTESKVGHIEVTKTARFWTLGNGAEDPSEIWYVLHGYRQLASRFLRRFQGIADGTRRIVAPEALSRFYVSDERGRHGPESVVGGTWMTREDRENEIRDYVRYLDRLHVEVGAPGVPVTVLGFSQGVATAARWVSYGDVGPERLIVWGDYLPPDLDMGRAAEALTDTELLIVRGSEDPALDEALRAREAEWLEAAGIRHEFVHYQGGHEIHREALLALV